MDDKIYEIKNNELNVYIPLKNAGKFRWKNRKDSLEYGKGFATADTAYTDDSYIEWQIGYDIVTSNTSKNTSLKNLTFTGANNKEKHPYELSEILYGLLQAGIVTNNEIEKLIADINNSNISLEEQYQIKTKRVGPQTINGINLSEIVITLPTFIYKMDQNGPLIEISIQKQQYATGVQPMLYMSIPIEFLKDGKNYIGKTSKDFPSDAKAIFVINKENKDYILNAFRLFGILSNRHKHDVKEILVLLNEYYKET